MHKSVILTKSLKEKLSFLLQEVLPEYTITSHDNLNYCLAITEDGEFRLTYFNWAELCLTEIPKRLGITNLVIPVDDDNFNLAAYLIEYYEEMKNSINEQLCSTEDKKVVKKLKQLKLAV